MTLLDDYEKQYAVLIAEITSQIAQIKLLGTGKYTFARQQEDDNSNSMSG